MKVKEIEETTTENTIVTIAPKENKKNEVSIDEKEKSQEKESFTILNDYQNTNCSDVLSIFGILTFFFILITLIVFITFSLINTKSTTIANGIYIKGVNISGLTKEEA